MERLQKVLANAGIASRRKSEEIILAGRVEVNEKIVNTLGVKVDPEQDIIKVDGRLIRSESKIYVLFHKPKGVISSVKDPEGRQVVTDYLKKIKQRVYPVGRLDYDTEGLLLLTNDGEFSNLMTHPKHHIDKTYFVTVKGVPHGSQLDRLKEGIELEDGKTSPAEVEYHDVNPDKNESIISITIHEGKNRQVRRMFEALSIQVKRLRRVQFGFLNLQRVSRGKFRYLQPNEVKELKDLALRTHKIQKND
ncbi:pseudouridine synthase [Chengkuizengella axinellae]|uniref:Pseudouridine synthase n=1 Tax=Chengkuizengella axinellae TaxID=3064388 RepID=A0ABT9IWL7_9BACL|nr:pseudouridine synthase [Chengkuizengella sp. 2205SS18-9]MDP5273760.1 pseudouridine synthase [Chengkuizengella sp. 2205SS18-9]